MGFFDPRIPKNQLGTLFGVNTLAMGIMGALGGGLWGGLANHISGDGFGKGFAGGAIAGGVTGVAAGAANFGFMTSKYNDKYFKIVDKHPMAFDFVSNAPASIAGVVGGLNMFEGSKLKSNKSVNSVK